MAGERMRTLVTSVGASAPDYPIIIASMTADATNTLMYFLPPSIPRNTLTVTV